MSSRIVSDTLGHVFSFNNMTDMQNAFYKRLVSMRAKREGTFINDRGRRHVKNRHDKVGVTYAFWLEKEPR